MPRTTRPRVLRLLLALAPIVACTASPPAEPVRASTAPLDYGGAQAAFLATTWKSVGPYALKDGNGTNSGRVNAIGVSPAVDAQGTPAMFLGTAGGGIWRSTDFLSASPTWEPVLDRPPADGNAEMFISAFAVDPQDPRTILAGTGDAATTSGWGDGLIKSTNGGLTWTRVDSGGSTPAIRKILFDPSDPNVAYLVGRWGNGYSGLFRSEDRGSSWTPWEQNIPDKTSVWDLDYTVDPSGAPTFYASVTDYGSTDPTAPGIYRRLPGAEWDNVAFNGDRTKLGVASLAADHRPATAGHEKVYALTYFGSGGFTPAKIMTLAASGWQPLQGSPTAFTQNGYGQAIAVAPDGTVYFGGAYRGGDWIFQSTNGGASWTGIGTGTNGISPHTDLQAWAFAGGQVFSGNDGGVFRFQPRSCGAGCTASGRSTWTSLNTPSLVTSLVESADPSPTDPAVFAAALQDNGFSAMTGTSWNLVGGEDGTRIRYMSDPQIVFASQVIDSGGWLQRSLKGGAYGSWKDITPSFPQYPARIDSPPFEIDAGGTRLLAATSVVFESTDYAKTWTPISPELHPVPSGGDTSQMNLRALAYAGKDSIWAASYNSVFHTTNHGATWSAVCPGQVDAVVALAPDPIFPTTMYMATSGNVFRTTDDGATCTDVTGDLPAQPTAIVVQHRRAEVPPWVFVGTAGSGAMVSMADDGHWRPFGRTRLPASQITELRFAPFTNKLVASTYGRGAWVADDSRPLDVLVHLQNIGDEWFHEDQIAGTIGQSRRLEGFQVQLDPGVPGLGLEYMAHLQGIGDTAWVPGGTFVGTRGQSRRLEGFAVRLTGPESANYDVVYSCWIQNKGNLGLVANGAFCGTRGQSLRAEAMMIRVVPRALVSPPIPIPLTVSRSGGGSVVGSPAGLDCGTTCTASYLLGTTVTLTATAFPGSVFSGWSGACSGTDTCTVTLDQPTNVGATFTSIVPDTYTLHLTMAQGSQWPPGLGDVAATPALLSCHLDNGQTTSSCDASFPVGTPVTLAATPGYATVFQGFSGACSGDTCALTMNADQSVTATFQGEIP